MSGMGTRPHRRRALVLAGQPPDPALTSAHELRNPGYVAAVVVGTHVRVRIRHGQSVDAVRPHLQAEHGLDELAGGWYALAGALLELHRVRVPALDLVTHDPAQHLAERLRGAGLECTFRCRDHRPRH